MNQSTTHDRLLECFRVVFPGVPDAELVTTSTESNSKWDSLAQITLISLIEEDLKTTLPLERYAELTSFSALLVELERARA